jgi:hypothetical protein
MEPSRIAEVKTSKDAERLSLLLRDKFGIIVFIHPLGRDYKLVCYDVAPTVLATAQIWVDGYLCGAGDNR